MLTISTEYSKPMNRNQLGVVSMSKILNIIAKVIPPVFALITIVIAAVSDSDDDCIADEKNGHELPE